MQCCQNPKNPTTSFCIEMMGLIGAGNTSMVGMTARVAVAVEEAAK